MGTHILNDELDVMIQDQTSDIVDYFLCRQLFELELAETVVLDSYVLNLVDGADVVNGTYICIQDGTRAFQGQVLSGGGTNTITLDTPLDYPFTTNAVINNRSPLLNVDGSTTAVHATLQPIPGVKWDVTRIMVSMTHSAAADDGKFGGIASLTKGIVLRKTNGIHHTIFNAKNNGDLRERAYDLAYSDRAPAGTYGTTVRRSFAGQDKNGVTIRLDGDKNEMLEILIQDNLTGLVSFKAVAQGHVVED